MYTFFNKISFTNLKLFGKLEINALFLKLGSKNNWSFKSISYFLVKKTFY